MPAEVFPGSLTASTINDVWYTASFWISLDGDDRVEAMCCTPDVKWTP